LDLVPESRVARAAPPGLRRLFLFVALLRRPHAH
jgi:hypothetical protein